MEQDPRLKDNPTRFIQPFIVNPVKDKETHEVVDFKITRLKVRRCFGTFSKRRGMRWMKAGSMKNWKHMKVQAESKRG